MSQYNGVVEHEVSRRMNSYYVLWGMSDELFANAGLYWVLGWVLSGLLQCRYSALSIKVPSICFICVACRQKVWRSHWKTQKPGSCSDLDRRPFNSHLEEGLLGCQWVDSFSQKIILNLLKYLAKESEILNI